MVTTSQTQFYRWDFIGLSTDHKPTPEESEDVTNGSTYYCSDTSQLFIFYDGTWYEKLATGGGGGGYQQIYRGAYEPTDAHILIWIETPAPYGDANFITADNKYFITVDDKDFIVLTVDKMFVTADNKEFFTADDKLFTTA